MSEPKTTAPDVRIARDMVAENVERQHDIEVRVATACQAVRIALTDWAELRDMKMDRIRAAVHDLEDLYDEFLQLDKHNAKLRERLS